MRKEHKPKIRERFYTWLGADGKAKEGVSFQVNWWLPNGDRYQRCFKSKKDALAVVERFKLEQDVERKNHVVSIANLSDDERIDVIEALKILNGRATLCQAAQFFVEHNNLSNDQVWTIDEAIDRYLRQSIEDGLRDRSLEDLRGRLQRFQQVFAGRPITTITRSEADQWLQDLRFSADKKYSHLSLKHFRVVVSSMFNWLVGSGQAKVNPFAPLSSSRRGKRILHDSSMPEILTVDQVKSLMAKAQEEVPEIVVPLAISFFAGLRTNELRQLDWLDINFDLKLITVRPEIAKKRKARHIAMEDNLVQWLMSYRQKKGLVAPAGSDYRKYFDLVRRLAGYRLDFADYPGNAGRHTFASMAMAKYQDAAKVALMLGHTTTGVLFDHYRSLATPQEAERYFGIVPFHGEAK